MEVSRLAGEHKLNLLFKTTRWSETANGSLVLSERGTTAERPTHAVRNQKNLHPRSSQARQESFCPLDKDLSWKSGNRTSSPSALRPILLVRFALPAQTVDATLAWSLLA